jgi:outer membrane protein TolC
MTIRLFLVAFVLLVLPRQGMAQGAEQFVRDAVRAATAVQQGGLATERDEALLARSRAQRLPSLTLLAQHVELSGGADIGALINPAFAALNQLTGTTNFPTDLTFTFPQRMDARARLAMPLFDPTISAAILSARASRDGSQAFEAATARQIDAAVRVGLLRHAALDEVVRLRRVVNGTLDEQLRVVERQAAEGLITPDVVLRARADQREGSQRLLEVERQRDAARRAINRVARRPLDAAIPQVHDTTFVLRLPSTRDDAMAAALAREELRGADAGIAAAQAGERLARAATLPTLTAALDVGFQGSRWQFTRDNDLRQLTVGASWTPFQSGRDAKQRTAARLDRERAELARQDAADAIALEVADAWDAHATARAALIPAGEREAAARRAWQLLQRRHAEGLATWLELSLARTAATAAETDLILARYAVAETAITLARVAALTPLAR